MAWICTQKPVREDDEMKKIVLAAASALVGAAFLFAASAHPAYAAGKVDCDAVMNEINSGKKVKEVAKDLNISKTSVYGCKRKAKAAAKAAAKEEAKPAAPAPAPAAPAPAPAAPAPAPAAPAPAPAAPQPK
jgi:hypothetical protein